jgi:hypothetical protein
LLLVAAGAFMLWKARAALAAPGLPEAVLLSRFALVEALMGALGLVAAGVALLALLPRAKTRTLRLRDLAPSDHEEGR